jgi:hypothetical protein
MLGAGALFACASEGSSSEADAKEKASTTTVAASDVVETTTTAPGEGTSTDGGSTGGSSTDGGQSGSSDTPSGPAPTITSFTTPENIDCHNGDFQEFTASWSTTNAAKVTISIDGPGVYAEYPANGEASLPFSCSTAHTFLLTAHSQDGQTVTKSVTLQPRNAQTGDSGDTEADL